MPIIIKEIQVKTTVHRSNQHDIDMSYQQKERLKNEIIQELKDYLRKEHLRKNER